MAYITIAIDGQVIGKWPLNGETVLGRAADCQIHVVSSLLSRRHLHFTKTPQGWFATDLKSKNGSFIGDERIAERLMEGGEIIRMGNVLAKFSAEPFDAQQPASGAAMEDAISSLLMQEDGGEFEDERTEAVDPIVAAAIAAEFGEHEEAFVAQRPGDSSADASMR